ncbi:hypothetical protein BGW42_001868 [Actinomortierella wolfii]|nr:hypothetical protein BGW42_001868 [Actinomortierella wolfii]
MYSTSRGYHSYQGNSSSSTGGGGDDDDNDNYHTSSTHEGSGVGFRTRYEDDDDDELMNPRASLLKEDASPPLQWRGMGLQHHSATDQEGLSSSRFGIDDIAGGAFAVPVSPIDRRSSFFNTTSTAALEPLSSSGSSDPKPKSNVAATSSASSPPPIPNATSSLNGGNTGAPKQRKWQSPSKAKANSVTASIASTLFSTNLLDDDAGGGEQESQTKEPAGVKQESKGDGDLKKKGMAIEPTASKKSNSPPPPSATSTSSSHSGFSFEALSKSRKGIVSGLTSLKNSIMIPSVHHHQQSSSTSSLPAATGAAGTRIHSSASGMSPNLENGSRPTLTHSQSNLLDNVVLPTSATYSEVLFDAHHHHPQRTNDHHRRHAGDRATKSESATPRTIGTDLGAGAGPAKRSGGRWGSASGLLKWSAVSSAGVTSRGYHSHQNSRTHSPWTSPSSSTVALVSPSALRNGGDSGGGPHHRHHRTETGSALQVASQHLTAVESEFQRLIQHQSQLMIHKAELDKELLSLYSRRNQCESKQSQAAAQEQFEEAEALRARARTIVERIRTVEPLLAEVERRLWDLGKRQLELGKTVAQSQLQLIHAMESWQEQRKAKVKQFHEQELQQREQEMQRITAEREKLEQERSDIALSVDFLGKNEQELKDRIEEETKAEQEQLRNVLDARRKIKDEIEELQQRLTQLRAKDVELDQDEDRLRQKIRKMTTQFDERAKEMRQERANLDDRISDMNRKAQQLDHSETEIQTWRQRSQQAQDEMEHEIQSLQEQQTRLTHVHAHFEHEMESIKALFTEEENFRELKTRWAMRASSLVEDLAKHEHLCQELATKLLEKQKQLRDLEQAIEKLEAQIPKLESSKNLAVQQRDFKQAAYYANEINSTKEAIKSKQKELEERRQAENGQEQERLTQLNEDFERLKTFVQEEEAKLAQEIDTEVKNISEQLLAKESSITAFVSQSASTVADEAKDSKSPRDDSTDKENTDQGDKGSTPAMDSSPKNPQLYAVGPRDGARISQGSIWSSRAECALNKSSDEGVELKFNRN